MLCYSSRSRNSRCSKPDKIDEAESTLLVRNIVKRIESELEYPGQIKVVVIRETRVVDFAK